MNIAKLGDAIVARLKATMPEGFTIDHFPDDIERFKWAGHDKTLLVSFHGNKYGEVQSMFPLSQSRATTMGVTVITRNLRGELGMIDVLELVRQRLQGWEPTERNEEDTADVFLGWKAIVYVEDRYVSEDNGVWRFVSLFQSDSEAVAAATPLTGPQLKTITTKAPTP